MTGDGRVLIACSHSSGLINPLLTIAGELKRRGTRDVWFASTDERRADIESLPGSGDVRFASMGPSNPAVSPDGWDDETLRRMSSGSRLENYAAYIEQSVDYDYMDRLYQGCLAEIDRTRPTLGVVDSFASWGMDAMMTRGVPFLISVSLPPSNFLQDMLPMRYPTPMSGLPLDMTPAQQSANGRFRKQLLQVLLEPALLAKSMAAVQARQAAGIRNAAVQPSVYAQAAVGLMAYTVFGFEFPFSTAPKTLRMFGPMVPVDLKPRDDGSELARWLDAHDSVVYVGFGTIMRPTAAQVAAIVDVAARLAPAHQVLWKLPADRHHLLPADLPGNLRIESWLPSQLEVLAHPHVRVFFNHGAANGIHEGLYFDKPQLVMPFWLDCHDGAVRAVSSGAALAVEHGDDLDVADISDKLDRLLTDESYRRCAAQWGQRMRDAGGVVAAADLILEQRDAATRTP